MTHHDLDSHPVPEDKPALFVNEPWLADDFREPGDEKWYDTPDRVRVYVPVDICVRSIMNKLRYIICKYGAATEKNEFRYRSEVDRLVFQIEVYDQVWLARAKNNDFDSCIICDSGMIPGHSKEGTDLVKQFVEGLKNIPDGCAERFPFETIIELEMEYLGYSREEAERDLF